MMLRRIIIIDDDRGDQKLMQAAIYSISSDVSVELLGNGEEGIKKSHGLKPDDVVILDTLLPGIDGFETCQRIKAINGDIKVIICTGVVDAVDAAKARAAGADDYCVKTSDYVSLINAIKNVTAV